MKMETKREKEETQRQRRKKGQKRLESVVLYV
jgi:hypothetical protein